MTRQMHSSLIFAPLLPTYHLLPTIPLPTTYKSQNAGKMHGKVKQSRAKQSKATQSKAEQDRASPWDASEAIIAILLS